jgi:hypothetical protein
MSPISRCFLLLATITLWTNVVNVCTHAAQETTAPQDPPAATAPVATTEEPKPTSVLEKWDRLIYVPFKELQKVFDNQEASVVLPYAEYLDLMKRAINAIPVTTGNQDAVITSSQWTAVVEKDLARINVELKVNVLKTEGWATLPVNFGSAAIGKVEPTDGTVLLKGTGQGTYELLLKGAGQKICETGIARGGPDISRRSIVRHSMSANRHQRIGRHDSGTRPDDQDHSTSGSVADRRINRRRQDSGQSQSGRGQSV